ncbi:hypothetical protein ACM1RC_30375 [Paenibacillus azoreducens]|uniref:hypothetical protein n=1 Tax=Paenibacillus azoreducens TaxID=116718 RepID=UPI0039F4E567
MNTIKLDWRKDRWMKRSRIKPMTDEVVRELLEEEVRAMNFTFDSLKQTFQFYRRYGGLIMPYSTAYLDETPLWKLKVYHRKNIRRFIFEPSKAGRLLAKMRIILRHRVWP